MEEKLYYVIYLLLINIQLSLNIFLWLKSNNQLKIKNKSKIIISSALLVSICSIFVFILSLIPLGNIFYIMFIGFCLVQLIFFIFLCNYGIGCPMAKSLFCLENSITIIFMTFQVADLINKIISISSITIPFQYKPLILLGTSAISDIFVFAISLNKKNINNMDYYLDSFSMSISYMMTIFITFLFLITNIFLIKNQFYLIVLSIGAIFYYAVRLLLDAVYVRRITLDEQFVTMKHIWDEEKKNYEIKKESMEMINIKYHDLKHWINNVKEGNNLNDMEYDIQKYEAVTKTDNEVLNVVFSNIATRCQMKNILFSCMVETDKLSFIDDMDLYSLFGNLLENAYEYEVSIEDNDDRFISLSIKNKANFIVIHIENYVVDQIKIHNNNVKTTKKDKANHGFGLESIKRTVAKYKGKLNIYVNDDMFQVDIVLPVEGDK